MWRLAALERRKERKRKVAERTAGVKNGVKCVKRWKKKKFIMEIGETKQRKKVERCGVDGVGLEEVEIGRAHV